MTSEVQTCREAQSRMKYVKKGYANQLKKSLIGQRFGALTVVSRLQNSESGASRWQTRCDCGGRRQVEGRYLRSKRSHNCGSNQHGWKPREKPTRAKGHDQ